MSVKFVPLAAITLIATLSFSLVADCVGQEAKRKATMPVLSTSDAANSLLSKAMTRRLL
jgi:hypothetical protein